jgi:serine/threonine protein kinase
MYECESPYLLKCFDVYENKDLKVLIIEYCNGKTLKAEIDERKRIPENEAWVILKHIINGLMV